MGLIGSDARLLVVTWSKLPTERPVSRLSRPPVLLSLVRAPAQPPQHAYFGSQSHTPANRCLRFERRVAAAPARSLPSCLLGFGRTRLALASSHQLLLSHPASGFPTGFTPRHTAAARDARVEDVALRIRVSPWPARCPVLEQTTNVGVDESWTPALMRSSRRNSRFWRTRRSTIASCASSGAPKRAAGPGRARIDQERHLSRLHAGRPLRLAAEDPADQLLPVRLRLLRQPPLLQRRAGALHGRRGRGAHRRLLQAQLHRGAVPLLRHRPLARPHDGAADAGREDAAPASTASAATSTSRPFPRRAPG